MPQKIFIKKAVRRKKGYHYFIDIDGNLHEVLEKRYYQSHQGDPGKIIFKNIVESTKNKFWKTYWVDFEGNIKITEMTKRQMEQAKKKDEEIDKYRRPWTKKIWRGKRQKILNERNKCEWCGSKNKLIIHHTKYPEEFGDSAYTELKDKESIAVICQKCHHIVHTYMRKACEKCHESYHNIRWDMCFFCFKKQLKNKEKTTKKDISLLDKRKVEEELIREQSNLRYKKEKKFFMSWKDKYSFSDYDYCTYVGIPESLISKWIKLWGRPYQVGYLENKKEI